LSRAFAPCRENILRERHPKMMAQRQKQKASG